MTKKKKQHRKSRTNIEHHSGTIASSKFIERTPTRLTLFAVAIILIRFLLSFFPNERLWGFNHLAFTSAQFAVVFSIGCIILLLPQIYQSINRIKLPHFFQMHSSVAALFLIVSSLCLIWFFPVKGYFLGDGFAYASELWRYLENASYNPDVLFSSAGSAPITGYIYAFIGKTYYSVLKNFYTSGSLLMTDTWTIGGMISVIFFILAVFQLIKILRKEYQNASGISMITIALLVLIPGSVFYFGYVEYYVFAYTATIWFIVISLEYIYTRKKLLAVILLFIISTAFHISGLFLLPSLLFLTATHFRMDWNNNNNKLYLVFITVIFFAALIYYFIFGSGELQNRFIMPLLPYQTSGGTQSYTLISTYNFIDTLNLILFLTITALIILFGIISSKRLSNPIPNDANSINHENVKIFTIILIISYAGLLIFGNSAFGKARDWDIYSIISVIVGSLAILTYLRIKKEYQKYVAYTTLIVSINGFVPWMYCNLSSSVTEKYFRFVLQLDEKHVLSDYALNGYEHLRKAYQTNGDKENVLWALKKKIELIGYPQDFRLTFAFFEEKDRRNKNEIAEYCYQKLKSILTELKSSKSHLIHAGNKNAFLDLAGEFLVKIYLRVDKTLAKKYAVDLKALYPNAVQLKIVDAEELHADDERYLNIYSEMAKVNSSSAILAYMSGLAYVLHNKYSEALSQLRFALKLNEKFFNAQFLLGVSYYYLQDTIRSRKYFTDYIKSETDRSNSLLKEAQNFLDRIKN